MTEANVFTVASWLMPVVAFLPLVGMLRLRRKFIRIVCAVFVLPMLIMGGLLFWYTHRPLPAEMNEQLFEGITYVRDIRSQPRPLVVHVVRIDLDAPELHFFVTPGGEDIPARTTSQFVDEFSLQLAINGDYFDPWRDYFVWDYYPHVGDPVNVRGLAASEGTVFTEGYAPLYNSFYDTLYITSQNAVSFDTPPEEIYNAISGIPFLLLAGESLVDGEQSDYYTGFHPRTAVGLDETGEMLILLLVDGRQPGYSEGVALSELSTLLLEYGAYHAINLDGGGSTTLVAESADGTIEVLNSPIHNRIPGRERPIANHLGIYARR